jgi:hypothetical protein
MRGISIALRSEFTFRRFYFTNRRDKISVVAPGVGKALAVLKAFF